LLNSVKVNSLALELESKEKLKKIMESVIKEVFRDFEEEVNNEIWTNIENRILSE
jgi:hypothetical protein